MGSAVAFHAPRQDPIAATRPSRDTKYCVMLLALGFSEITAKSYVVANQTSRGRPIDVISTVMMPDRKSLTSVKPRGDWPN